MRQTSTSWDTSTYHYSADLMALMVDAIPALNKSKMDVITFFKGAGVGGAYVADLEQQVRVNRSSIGKHAIVRTVLTRINEHGDLTLRERRDVLRRVVEFENFSMCWPDDRDIARARVADIRELVNVKDSFTRMKNERDLERQKHQREADARAQALRSREVERERICNSFAALFGNPDPWKRGKALEGVLNQLFRWYGIGLREAFTLRGDEGQGVVEQIDGVIVLDGQLYLVEIKWWNEALGVAEIAPHLVRLFSRGEGRGIVIAHPGFSAPAIQSAKEALHHKVVVLSDLEEIFRAIDTRSDLGNYLKRKVEGAILDKAPYSKPAFHVAPAVFGACA